MEVHKKYFKCSIFLLTFAVIFALTTTNITANAMTIKESTEKVMVDTDRVSKIVELKNVDVSIFEDGRIKPINNPESLTKEERKSVMRLMEFSDDEIESFPEGLINEILADGGVKIEVTQEDVEHIYTDLQGNDHIVTPETMDEVNKIKLKDSQLIANKMNLNSGINTLAMGKVQSGTFTGKGILTYLGKTSNNKEYEYLYRTSWEFSQKPKLSFKDSIATSWQSHTTSVSTIGRYNVWANGGFSYHDKVKINRSSVAGTKATIDLQHFASGRHYGYIEDRVRIPISGNTGTTGQFSSAYGHSTAPAGMGISINIGGWGSISFSGSGDKWSWRNSFTIGQNK